MKRFWIFAATISGAILSTAAQPAGNAETGATKAVVCQACHGASGNSVNPEWPSLAGLGADYIADQLQNFKDGKRNNPVMMPNAANLSADDMANLGAYFDSLVNTGLEADPSYWQSGEKLYRCLLYTSDSTAEKYLRIKTIHYEDVAGKGAKQITFNQVDVDLSLIHI